MDGAALSRAAAADAARAIRTAIGERGSARIVAATGASQIAFLQALTGETGIDWPRVELFHLDEYVGLPLTHPASFRRYLLDRLIVPTGITRFHLLDGERDPDVAFVGIGENGHLAFNDPPADFETVRPYLVVRLDEACRRQQVGEGWFASLDDVPSRAISMSVRQILKAQTIVAVVPDARKATAVEASIQGPVSPLAPASILRCHPDTSLYLDQQSAALLPRDMRGEPLGNGAA